MKKTQRVGAIIKILSDCPNRTFGLKYFCDAFGAAKSSISEDLKTVKSIFSEMDMGFIETTPGAGGGVKMVPYISDEAIKELQAEICTRLSDNTRLLGGGFLYTSDVMFDPMLVRRVATVFTRKFQNKNADFIATIETKGIPVAVMTAFLLNLPLVVIRRESKVSEGSTVSINYFSGSYDRIQKMSIAKRAIVPGSKAIIIDDFMRGGGSVKGISEILSEFDVSIAATGIVMTNIEPQKKKIEDYISLFYLDSVDEDQKTIKVLPNNQIF
ncbi:MAG: pur operon repressor [Eubacteriales bacterium]|nr:pur operon repressor [Eubacteriales bacterium]MDD4389236.1 pur operon repressor [Eubacteriales bacterium]